MRPSKVSLCDLWRREGDLLFMLIFSYEALKAAFQVIEIKILEHGGYNTGRRSLF